MHNVTYFNTTEYQIDMAGIRSMDPRDHRDDSDLTLEMKELLWKQFQATQVSVSKSIPATHR